jgi:hypothetical protein
MTSNQLQWAAISGAAAIGLGLLVYDLQSRKVETTEDTHVELRIEEVGTLFQLQCICRLKDITAMALPYQRTGRHTHQGRQDRAPRLRRRSNVLSPEDPSRPRKQRDHSMGDHV